MDSAAPPRDSARTGVSANPSPPKEFMDSLNSIPTKAYGKASRQAKRTFNFAERLLSPEKTLKKGKNDKSATQAVANQNPLKIPHQNNHGTNTIGAI